MYVCLALAYVVFHAAPKSFFLTWILEISDRTLCNWLYMLLLNRSQKSSQVSTRAQTMTLLYAGKTAFLREGRIFIPYHFSIQKPSCCLLVSNLLGCHDADTSESMRESSVGS